MKELTGKCLSDFKTWLLGQSAEELELLSLEEDYLNNLSDMNKYILIQSFIQDSNLVECEIEHTHNKNDIYINQDFKCTEGNDKSYAKAISFIVDYYNNPE